MNPASPSTLLEQGLRQLPLEPTVELLDPLLSYLELLEQWNSAYNLTSVRDPRQMVYRHLLDSLAVAAHIPAAAERIIDVGSGAGLPGVPLAILQRQKHFDLLDSNGKKTRFLFQVKTALGLDNMSVRQVRAESWMPEQPYDVVLSRAFTSLADMVSSCAHLCADQGCFLAMKGTRPAAELAAVADLCEVRQVHVLHIPGLGEERHLIELGPQQQGRTGNTFG